MLTIVARWSGARRDEIRRLAIDCLDTHPDGHPRLRIPVGKGHTERSIPQHPAASRSIPQHPAASRSIPQHPAASRCIPLHPAASRGCRRPATVDRAGPPHAARDQLNSSVGGRCSTCSWSAASCCSCSIGRWRRRARPQAWSMRGAVRRSARTGSDTPSAPSSPRAAVASRRSWRCSGTGPRRCRRHLHRPSPRSRAGSRTPETSPGPRRGGTRCRARWPRTGRSVGARPARRVVSSTHRIRQGDQRPDQADGLADRGRGAGEGAMAELGRGAGPAGDVGDRDMQLDQQAHDQRVLGFPVSRQRWSAAHSHGRRAPPRVCCSPPAWRRSSARGSSRC
jgi:hypothetical protein